MLLKLTVHFDQPFQDNLELFSGTALSSQTLANIAQPQPHLHQMNCNLSLSLGVALRPEVWLD